MHITMTRRLVLSGLALSASIAGARIPRALANTWPTGAVKIIVPVPAGTATDLTARLYGERLAQRWKQPVVVDPKPGGDGLVGLGAFANLRDENALLFAFMTAVSLNPFVYKSLPYDPIADLVPIATTTEVLFGLGAGAATGISSLADLIARARAAPGKLNWSAAPGLPHFVFERFRLENKLAMNYVGYRQTGTAVIDLGEGRLDVLIASTQTMQPALDTQKARLLLVCSPNRIERLGNVPSATDAATKDLIVPGIGCVFGGRGMAQETRLQIARDIEAVSQDSDLVSQLAKIGQFIRRANTTETEAMIAEQRVSLASLASIMSEANK